MSCFFDSQCRWIQITNIQSLQRLRFVLTILTLYKFVCMYVCMYPTFIASFPINLSRKWHPCTISMFVTLLTHVIHTTLHVNIISHKMKKRLSASFRMVFHVCGWSSTIYLFAGISSNHFSSLLITGDIWLAAEWWTPPFHFCFDIWPSMHRH